MSSASLSSELCVGCGLCCDGTLYEHAKVAPGEEAAIGKAGLRLMQREGRTVFRQPCAHFAAGRCTIFDSGRFRICADFECALLRRAKAGECTVAEARATIAEARALLAKVVTRNPLAKFASARRRSRARLAEAVKSGATAGDAQHLLHLIALDAFLERWFRLPHEKKAAVEADEDQRPSAR